MMLRDDCFSENEFKRRKIFTIPHMSRGAGIMKKEFQMTQTEKELFDSVLCGIIRYAMDEDAQILQFNSSCAQIYGFGNREEFSAALESGDIQPVYIYDKEIFRGFIRRCIHTGKTVNFGHRIMRKDGTLAYVMGTMRVTEMSDGERIVQTMFMDSGYHVVQEDVRRSIKYLPANSNGREKVIVVSESPEVRRELKEILMPECVVIEAASGQEIRSILNKEQDDIGSVLVDEDIVSQDDFRFMASLKSNILLASIPIVILARPDGADEEQLLSYGASEFLRRPFNAEVVRLRISNLLELRDTAIQRNAIESMVDNIPGGVVIFRVGSRLELLYDSKKLSALGDWDEEDRLRVRREGLDCLIYEADRARITKNLFDAAEKGSTVELTFRLFSADEKAIWVQAHAILIRKEGNKPVYQAVITPTSVREKMYQNILDDSSSAVAVNDDKTDELLYINNAAAALAEECGESENYPWLAFRGEKLPDTGYISKQIITEKSGRHLNMNGRHINWNGIPARIVFLADDTESYRLQNEQLEKALEAAKKANEAKSSFLSRMSHDIRTPMNAILGMSSLALDELGNQEAVKDYLEKISSSGQYLLGLINDILDMSKIESNHIELNLSSGTVKQCLHDVMISMQVQLDQKKQKLTVTQLPDAAEHPVLLDKMRIQQIFFNLLSNAVKFTGEGGNVYVTIRRDSPADGVAGYFIDVRDTGIGIEEEAQKRIFEPFEQAGPQTRGGSGLGLAIVRNLLQLMGGSISVESVFGSGTTFHVQVSFRLSDTESAKSRKTENEDYNFSGYSVLVVEDHPVNMMIARKLLEKKNCRVSSAINGQEALDILMHCEPNEFQAVLMDIRMPVLNGIEAAKQIRSSQREDLQKLPIIAMSANAFEEDAERSKAAGMNAHLTKPIDNDLLYRTLKNIWSEKNEHL